MNEVIAQDRTTLLIEMCLKIDPDRMQKELITDILALAKEIAPTRLPSSYITGELNRIRVALFELGGAVNSLTGRL